MKPHWQRLVGISSLLAALTIWSAPGIEGMQGSATTAQPPPGGWTAAAWRSMSPAEKLRSHLFDKYKSHRRVFEKGGRLSSFGDDIIPLGGRPALPSTTAKIREMACRADFIFSGTALSRKSMPIEDGTFLFSDYQFKVDRVVRSARPLSQGDVVVVTRPGGEVTGPGPAASSYRADFPRLPVGQPLLLMVVEIPGDSGFETRDALGAFTLLRGQAKTLIELPTAETDLSKAGIPITQLFDLLNNVDCSGGGETNGR